MDTQPVVGRELRGRSLQAAAARGAAVAGSGIGTAGLGSRWITQNPRLRRRAGWPCDVTTSHGGRDPGTDGGQVRGERRRARCADAEMRWAMSGEVENGDGKPVHPLPGGVQEGAG